MHIRAQGARFVEVDSTLSGTIPPHQVQPFGLTLQPLERLHPGKYTLVFDVALEWPSSTGLRTGNIVVPQEIELGVFAESVVLKALTVPSFLLLPGFLMVVAFALVWQFEKASRGAKSADFPLKPTAAEFWVVAITLSALMAIVYPRNYLDAYGTRDLVEVWLVSVIFGTLGGFVWWFLTRAWIVPSAKDPPLKILQKLGRQGLGTELELVKLDGENRGFLLQRKPEDERAVWVGPTIAVTWQSGATAMDRDRFSSLRKSRKPGPLASFLKAAEVRQALRVSWKPDGAVPEQVTNASYEGSAEIIEPQT